MKRPAKQEFVTALADFLFYIGASVIGAGVLCIILYFMYPDKLMIILGFVLIIVGIGMILIRENIMKKYSIKSGDYLK